MLEQLKKDVQKIKKTMYEQSRTIIRRTLMSACSVVSDSSWPHGLKLARLLCHEIFQARTLESVVISYSKVSSQPRDPTLVSCVSCTDRQILYHCATQEAHHEETDNLRRNQGGILGFMFTLSRIDVDLIIAVSFRWNSRGMEELELLTILFGRLGLVLAQKIWMAGWLCDLWSHFSLIQQMVIYLLLCSSSCIHTDTNICTCTHTYISRDNWNKIDKINLILFSGKCYK